jgi:cobalamin biosynthetic protein CobC
VDDLPASVFTRLPEQDLFAACREAMAVAFGCRAQAVLVAPGSAAVIAGLPSLLAAKRVAVMTPTYTDHARSWRAAGADVREATRFEKADADILVVGNPNNPDGRRHEPKALLDMAASQAKRGGWLVVDEAFADVAPELSVASAAGAPGLLVLRSFGKFYGLGGLRLGALLAPAEVLEAAAGLLGSWAVSGPALAIGARAYADKTWRNTMRVRLAEAAARFDEALGKRGVEVSGGCSLFRYVAMRDAHGTWRRLAMQGLAVRRFSWTTTHLRIGLPPDEAALARLEVALADV